MPRRWDRKNKRLATHLGCRQQRSHAASPSRLEPAAEIDHVFGLAVDYFKLARYVVEVPASALGTLGGSVQDRVVCANRHPTDFERAILLKRNPKHLRAFVVIHAQNDLFPRGE